MCLYSMSPNLIDDHLRDTLCRGLYTCYLERIKLHYFLFNSMIFFVLVFGVTSILVYSYYHKKGKKR